MRIGNLAEASSRDLLFPVSLLTVPAVVMALVSGLAHKSTSSKERGFESLSCHQFLAPGIFDLGLTQAMNREREREREKSWASKEREAAFHWRDVRLARLVYASKVTFFPSVVSRIIHYDA